MVYMHGEIGFSHKNEALIHYSMDGFWGHDAKINQTNIAYYHLYMEPKNAELPKRE